MRKNNDLDKLIAIVELLAKGEKLDVKYRNHDILGNYKGTKECYIEFDGLLVYEYQNDVLVFML